MGLQLFEMLLLLGDLRLEGEKPVEKLALVYVMGWPLGLVCSLLSFALLYVVVFVG
jgi:uncharacterized membrane protein